MPVVRDHVASFTTNAIAHAIPQPKSAKPSTVKKMFIVLYPGIFLSIFARYLGDYNIHWY